MTLEEKVTAGIKLAMTTKNLVELRGLRAVKAAILLLQTEKGYNGKISEEQEIALLQKMIKQRKESLAIFEEQNRTDLAQKEIEEIEVIDQFLPAQLSDEEITKIVKELISKTGASSIKEMGKVMGMASKEFAGRADNSKVSQIIKSLLS